MNVDWLSLALFVAILLALYVNADWEDDE